MKTENALEEWGLSDKESKVYLATLELGQARVNDIAKKAKILRETTYFVLDNLISRGLVSHVIRSGVKYFEAADPQKFVSILKDRQQAMKEVMPNLELLKKTQLKKPSVEMYEGKEGLKTILDDIIRTKKPLYAYASSSIFELLSFDFPKFVVRRIENKIRARIIQERTKKLEKRSLVDRKELREMRFSSVKFKSNVFIYGNKVAFINVKKNQPLGVIIDNAEISGAQRQVFDMLWNMSGR